ncbi:hypothetical protein H0H87_005014 [Tephrocybe sp. NHM501043]|nr:hypothetical protein H0H87_005014 [Tephrocybe sp. NHM501043]
MPMARRPPSTAGSSRPYTSNGGRPTTAAGKSTHYDHHDPQYTYGDYDIEEEEEESDDEDVFAFLPPSTAEQQHQHQPVQQHPSQHHYIQDFAADNPTADEPFSHSIPSPHLAYPSPTYDPYARFPADTGVGPSTPQFQYFQPAPETPPSTDSNNHNSPSDHYRLRRINSPGTAISGAPLTAESHEVRVSLPEGSQASATGSEKDVEMEAGTSRRRYPKRHDSSITDSLSLGRSMVEDDDDTSRDGSIK